MERPDPVGGSAPPSDRVGINLWDYKRGLEGEAFEGASGHAGKLAWGATRWGQATPSQIDED